MLMCFAITYKRQQVMKPMKRVSNNQYICRKRLGANSPGNVGRQGQTLRAKWENI